MDEIGKLYEYICTDNTHAVLYYLSARKITPKFTLFIFYLTDLPSKILVEIFLYGNLL